MMIFVGRMEIVCHAAKLNRSLTFSRASAVAAAALPPSLCHRLPSVAILRLPLLFYSV